MMTLPQPIVTYQKRASDHPDPFGSWCKLHYAFLIHLAEARLSGAAYKVVLQVLCSSFHFGQYHPAALSLEQFQNSQHLGRKAVIEGLRQAVARGILYEERGWQVGAHAPKQYGLVFYRAVTVMRGGEDQGFRLQGMTLLKGGAFPRSASSPELGNGLSQQEHNRSSSTGEPYRKTDEKLEATTSSEIEPVTEVQRLTRGVAGAEIEPVAVRQPHQTQFGSRTSAGALTEPEASLQRSQNAASYGALELEERTEDTRTPATLVPPLEAAREPQQALEEQAAPFSQHLPPTVAAPPNFSSSDQQENVLAILRAEYERRQAALAAWHPHGVEQIQAKIAARLEVRRLERQIEELETPLAPQVQRTQEGEDPCAVGQPGETRWCPATGMSAPERPFALPLQVAEEQLAVWRADVVAQQRVVRRVTTQYQAVTEQLQQCRIGRGNWGALVREQRFLAGDLEEQKAQLARYEQFVALIEQGAIKEEACEQILELHPQVTSLEPSGSEELPPTATSEDQPLAESAPKLEGQQLRQALFTTLARLFTNGDPRHIDLERGKFNRAIKNLVAVDAQPEDLPVLKAAFEKRWPKATCTALGIANNLPILLGTIQHLN
jgi:hypothetical protein